MSITSLAIQRPILFIVFFIVLGGLGIFAYTRLNYELLPDLATPFVTVFSSYPGASPAEVENSVTKKIEDGVAGVSKIKKITSNSSTGLSVVTIEFIANADANLAVQEVQRALSTVVADLPAAVKTPAVEKFNINDLPVLRLGVTGSISETALYTLLDTRVRPRLQQLNSVGRVTLLGGAKEELRIFADAQKLSSVGLSNLELAEALRRSNSDFPVGNIKDTDAALDIRLSGKVFDNYQILNQPVRTLPDGSTIKLRDVARIETATKEVEVFNRVNRQPSIGLFVSRQSGANAVEVSKLVRAEVVKLEEEFKGSGLHFTIAQDSSEFTLTAAHAVYKDFFIAIILVALVMLVFLHSLRNALIVMLAIPTSLFSAFIMMYLLGYSLNLMTLLAMSLVIGILVDDSIVVLENIYRHMEMGKDKIIAALEGRNEIGFAALSITLVDVVVFLPMALVPGLVGSLVKQFSLVIVVSTLSSLLVSFTLTPMIASRFARLEHLSGKSFFGKAGLFIEKGIERFTNLYERILRWSLLHKAATLLIAFVLLAGSLLLAGSGIIGSEFTPATDKGEISLLVNMQPGTPLSETDKAVRAIEEKLQTLPEITTLFTSSGYQSDGFTESYNTHVASINISLAPQKDRTSSLPDLGRKIRRMAMEVAGVKARVAPVGLFGANDAQVQLLLSGSNRDTLMKASNGLLSQLRTVPGLVSPRLSAEQGKPEIDVTINREQAALLGLTIEAVGASLRTAVNGYDDMKFRKGDRDIDVRLQLEGGDLRGTDALSRYSLINDKGQVVYLNQFAQIHLRSSPSILERRDKQPGVLLLSQVAGRPVGDAGEDIRKIVAQHPLPPGVSISYEGDLELQNDSFGQLALALVASILLIYLIMVALYNNWSYPLVVLFSIPVALVGAFLALALTAKSLNIFTIFGLIMLMGLVAKNAILLVDRANEVLPGSLSLTDALVEAGRTRLRPILMTTLAMVIGMLPLALAKGAAAELNSGLAWVLIGGLSSSMILTLVVIPVVYDGLTRWLQKRAEVKKKNKDTHAKKTLINVPGIAGCLILVLLMSATAKAQQRISVDQAVAIGIDNNREVKVAQLEEWKAFYSLREAQSNRYPAVNATASYIRHIKAPVFFFPSFGADANGGLVVDQKNLMPISAALKNDYNAAIGFSMPLYNREISSGIKLAQRNAELSHANTAVTKAQLAAEIRKAGYALLVALSGKALVEASIRRAEINLASARGLLLTGDRSDADTLAAFVNFQITKPALIRYLNSIEQATDYLKTLMGMPDDATIVLSDELDVETDIRIDLSASLQEAMDNRPELAQNNAQTAIAQAQLESDKSRKYPTLSLVSQYQLQTQANDYRFSNYKWPNSFYAGVQLNVPIFSGFKNDVRVRNARISLQQSLLQKEHVTERVSLEVRTAAGNLHEARCTWKAQREVVPSAERNLQMVTARWQKGFARYSEVADAELMLVQVRNNLLQAAYQYLLARAAHLKATGQY